MPLYMIEVTALIPEDQLDPDDREDVEGVYAVDADDEDEALDLFHSAVAIHTLDDFEIDIREIKGFQRLHKSDIENLYLKDDYDA